MNGDFLYKAVTDAISDAEDLERKELWQEAALAWARVAGIEAAIAFTPPEDVSMSKVEREIGRRGVALAMASAQRCEEKRKR